MPARARPVEHASQEMEPPAIPGRFKEPFTSADNYVLEISDAVSPDSPVCQLVLAAVMCIDMVLRE